MSDRTSPDRDRPDPDRDDGPLAPFGGSAGHDLDAELRRLFGDDRLSVPVATGAGDAVVSGARRRRRNRLAMAAGSGVLAATAIVFAGVALAGLGHPNAITPAGPGLSTTVGIDTTTPTSDTPRPTSVTQDPVAGLKPLILGPYGLGALRLGMSQQMAIQTRALMAQIETRTSDCRVYNGRYVVGKSTATSAPPAQTLTLPVSPEVTGSAKPPQGAVPITTDPAVAASGMKNVAEVVLSTRAGVVEFLAAPGMITPEGVGIGSNVKQLLASYPKSDISLKPGPVTIPVPDNPGAYYVFTMDSEGQVVAFSLESKMAMLCPSKK